MPVAFCEKAREKTLAFADASTSSAFASPPARSPQSLCNRFEKRDADRRVSDTACESDDREHHMTMNIVPHPTLLSGPSL